MTGGWFIYGIVLPELDGISHRKRGRRTTRGHGQRLMPTSFGRLRTAVNNRIKGPDNPTSQLLPIMSFKGCSGVGEGRKDKGGGERSRR